MADNVQGTLVGLLAANQLMADNVQGTLVGLLAAFSYELSILHTASRLTSADAFRALHALYRERTHPVSAAFPSSDVPSSSTGEGGGSPTVYEVAHNFVSPGRLLSTCCIATWP